MYQIRKSERLHNFRLKKHLFEKGKSFTIYPFKIFWQIINTDYFSDIEKPILRSSVTNNENRSLNNQNDDRIKSVPESAVFYFPVKAIFSVSSKKIRKASDRNYIKRLIKESYRKNKNDFYSFLRSKELNCLIAFIYIDDKKPTQIEVEEKIVITLQYIIKGIENVNP